jgi:hypothetical protein
MVSEVGPPEGLGKGVRRADGPDAYRGELRQSALPYDRVWSAERFPD